MDDIGGWAFALVLVAIGGWIVFLLIFPRRALSSHNTRELVESHIKDVGRPKLLERSLWRPHAGLLMTILILLAGICTVAGASFFINRMPKLALFIGGMVVFVYLWEVGLNRAGRLLVKDEDQ